MAPNSSKPPSSSFEGDFAPGEVLIGRYRIVALVGEGGMGQVYLADDLVLGLPVAVKFLPEHIAQRDGGLDRFRGEVRHAREVTHPNVARVHDIGEVNGRHFLTMEFVDGEDLSSLVRRIGRLPQEKAAEIAQQICAGLAEAHRKGVLHRDLKPANVMLDGEGRARLTDFGLAVAAETGGDTALAGTPQYMAPEQLAGVAASVQSEVYSLGLVLYELYTGQRALRGHSLDQLRLEHEEGGPASASTHLDQLDPEIDAVLTRCLARDPEQRPRSVTEVARALPGGDPLAAALAAGKTPAPDLVAAAETEGALAPRRAATLVGMIVLLFVMAVLGRSWQLEQDGVSYGKPSAYLRERARELARELSGAAEFANEVHWHNYDKELAAAIADLGPPVDGGFEWPQTLLHHSRFGPRSFTPRARVIDQADPAPGPNEMHLVLDANGRLLSWTRWMEELPASSPAEPVNWQPLLDHAGLPSESLVSVEPALVPRVFASERAAWLVRTIDPGGGELRIEAAALAGNIVHFGSYHAGNILGRSEAETTPPLPMNLFMLVVIVLSALVAWRNVRAGRADVRGAILVGVYLVVTHVILALGMPLPGSFGGFAAVMTTSLGSSLHTGVRVALLYLALEPFARRRWPRVLIGWSRLLQGRFRDASLGREILAGLLASAVVVTVGLLLQLGLAAVGIGQALFHRAIFQPLAGIEGPLQTVSHLLHFSGDSIMFAGTLVFVLVLLRSLIHLRWVPDALWVIGMTLLLGGLHGMGVMFVFLIATLVLLARVGFLSVVALFCGFLALSSFPFTLRTSDWYFSSSLVIFVVIAFLLAWSYRAAVGDQRARAGGIG